MSGDTLQQADFDLLTPLTGHESRISLTPTTVSTSFQTQDVTVTGSCGDGELDDVMTTVLVVSENSTSEYNVEFTIPNYIKQPLETLGVADELEFSTSNSYSSNKECCSDKVATSRSGETDLVVHLPTVAIPIMGIPLPEKIEKYARADISIELTGSGAVSFKGTYNGCSQAPSWTGRGSVGVGIALTGGVKGKIPDWIVIGAEAKGETSITEILEIIDTNTLKISANWSGLTGTVSGILEIHGIDLELDINESWNYFEADNISPVTISLPEFNTN